TEVAGPESPGPLEARLLVVRGLRRARVRARGGQFLPPVRPAHHLPDLPLGQIRVRRRRVRLDDLDKVVIVLAIEVDQAVRRIRPIKPSHVRLPFLRPGPSPGSPSVRRTIGTPLAHIMRDLPRIEREFPTRYCARDGRVLRADA